MNSFIDIGIDFGAENIVVTAIGYDNLGRSDYKLVSLDASGTTKNYIGKKKDNEAVEIGNEVKISYAHNNPDNEYEWLLGRYKANIGQDTELGYGKNANELLKYGLEAIIKKIETFDFSAIFSGKLRNLTVGIPQSWDYEKKLIYKNILACWKYGEVSLLSEPIAATIAGYKKSISDIDDNIIMVLDIGAGTFDISFAEYSKESRNFHIYKTNSRSEFAGHYFDMLLTSFALLSDVNKLACGEFIETATRLKLRKVEDYLSYIQKNSLKFSSFLLEIEGIKENNLVEISKFNKKKLIDIGTKNHIIINKQIYTDALKYYSDKLSNQINQILTEFKQNESTKKIYPFLCGGGSSLVGLEKELKDKVNKEQSHNLFSIQKDSSVSGKIDITIAIGLACYAQDKTIISNKLDFSLLIELMNEDESLEKLEVFSKGEKIPVSEPKNLSALLNIEKALEYIDTNTNKIEFKIIKKLDESETPFVITFPTDSNFQKNDEFDLSFNLETDLILSLCMKNINSNQKLTRNILIA